MRTERDYRRLERFFSREGRWEDLSAVLIEHAEASSDDGRRANNLVRAAQICEGELQDPDRAFILLLAAFQIAPSHKQVISELPRLATSQVRWRDLLEESSRLSLEAEGTRRAEMLLVLAKWQEHELGDQPRAEQALEDALDADPNNKTALQRLVTIHSQRQNWARVAAYLTRAAHHAKETPDRVRLLLEATEIYRDKLHDNDAACVELQRVLEASPGHPQATRALADIFWSAKDWSGLKPVLESILSKAKPRLTGDMAIMHHRAGISAQMLGDYESARLHFQAATSSIPNHIPSWLCWAQLAFSQHNSRDILVTIPQILKLAPDRISTAEQLGYLRALGDAHLEDDDPEAAAAAFARALEIAPDNQACREGLVEAHGQAEEQGDFNAGLHVEQQRLLLPGAVSSEERFQILGRIMRLQLEAMDDAEAALKTCLEALTIKPHDQVMLLELVDIYSSTERWQEAVETLQQLVELEEGSARAEYLRAMAKILNYELWDKRRAVEVYNMALDEDPSDLKSFERIHDILSVAQDWRGLAHQYGQMIRRIPSTPESRSLLLSLWRQLGELSLRYLADFSSAAAAFDVCLALAPDATEIRGLLLEALERQGAPGMARVVRIREQIVEQSTDAGAVASHLRALLRLYGQYGEHDRAWCICAGLVALVRADAGERLTYEREAPLFAPLGQMGLSEEQWQQSLCHPAQDRAVGAVLATVSSTVALIRATAAHRVGLDPGCRIDVHSDTTSVSRMLINAAWLLGLELPAVYVSPGAAGELELINIVEDQRVVPAIVLGQELINARSDREVIFVIARKLAGLRPEHTLLWPQMVSGMNELQVIFAAAVKLVRPDIDLPTTDPVAAGRYLELFRSALPPEAYETLSAAVSWILAEPSRLDLATWVAAAEESANRAGLLCCGDLVAAARELVKDARLRGTRPEAGILSLTKWSTSTRYFELRERLGLTLTKSLLDDATPVEPPFWMMNPARA